MNRRDAIKLIGAGAAVLAAGGASWAFLNKETETETKEEKKMKTIFDSTELGAVKLKNRIWRSATWTAQSEDGHINDRLVDTYRTLAHGGVGAIITGLTSISPYDADLNGGVKFCDDSDIAGHRRLTDAVHQEGAAVYLQTAMVDSFIKGFREGEGVQVDIDRLTLDNIRTIIGYFGDAAGRAERAGYDGVQIHAAHFFFLSMFISPAVNHRTDEYGGSPEKRAKILVDILKDMRSKTSDGFSIIVKINAVDYMQGGLTVPDFITACKMLEEAGIDAIEVSANGTSVPGVKPFKDEAYFLEYAEELKKNVDVPVILVGGHRSVANMERVLNSTEIEYLSLSRPLIREPDLVNRWRRGDVHPALCVSCNNCYRTEGHQCVFNR